VKKKNPLTYRKLLLMNLIDGLFIFIPLVVAIVWIISSIYSIITNGWFGRAVILILPNWTIRIHSLTVLSITSFFLFTFWCLNYLLPHVRTPVACAITALGFLFYDFSWIVCDFLTTGSGNPIIQLCLVLAAILILLFHNKFYHYLSFQRWIFIVILSIHVVSMYLLSVSGFFQTLHAGLDPHPGNWLWFVGKFTGIWTWSGIYQKRVKE